jgi:hypothetical protein
LIDKRLLVTVSFGIVVTIIVYLGIADSLKHPSISRLPISPEIAISKVIKSLNISEKQLNSSLQYVYIKSDGTVYMSNPGSNELGKITGITEPPNIPGSHFAWEIKDIQTKKKYYVDAIFAEIISNSSYK